MDGPNSVCRDEFEISNLVNGNFRIPTICGYNTGEHSKLFIKRWNEAESLTIKVNPLIDCFVCNQFLEFLHHF